MQSIDFSSWIAGWTSLAAVVAFGIFLILNSVRVAKSRKSIATRILVTGSRGKSGTVRLIHAALTANDIASYAKITGTEASELFVDKTEVETRRLGPATTCEMNTALIRAAKQDPQVGIFECMAVSPKIIKLVTEELVKPEIVIIPTIRLDHLEEEGLSEFEIAMTVLNAASAAKIIFTGVSQPEIVAAYREFAQEHNLDIRFVLSDPGLPEIPGHHPTNIALALAVAEEMGVSREAGIEAMRQSSLEPNARTFERIERADGSELLLIDLGAANDPESAREAFTHLGLNRGHIAPVIVNRWERPLRSLTFISAAYGRFGTVGVAGTLHTWANRWVKRENRRLNNHGAHTRFVKLGFLTARKPEAIWAWTQRFRRLEHRASRSIVLFENIHDRSADRLRKTFASTGQVIDQEELKVKHG